VTQLDAAVARYLVLDLSQVSRCDQATLTARAAAARRMSLRRGRLRLVATSHNGTRHAS
jgi:anti-anti-sigma regulatory factor